MNNHAHDENHDYHLDRRVKWVLFGFLIVGGFFLITEHAAHLLGWLPFAFLLACPLMHFFMHGHHGSHGHHNRNNQPASGKSDDHTGGHPAS